MKLILASSSPRRRELLQQLGLNFIVHTKETDESFSKDLAPQDVVQVLALRKAEPVAHTIEEGIVIGADTMVALEKQILGKPQDPTEAFQMLEQLSGRNHIVYSGIALCEVKQHRVQRSLTAYRSTTVTMRTLNKDRIAAYIQTGEPLDKAGAYGIQGQGASLVEKIDGCYFNVVGLSLVLLDQMMEQLGYPLYS